MKSILLHIFVSLAILPGLLSTGYCQDPVSPDLLQMLQPGPVTPSVDTTFGQGTDLNAGKSAVQMALPQMAATGQNLTTGQAVAILDCAVASLAVYDNPRNPWPTGWSSATPELHISENRLEKIIRKTAPPPLKLLLDLNAGLKGVGFHAAAYKTPEGKIVIAFEGTDIDEFPDIVTDLAQAVSVPAQYQMGEDYVRQVIGENPGVDVVLTGHSLGGGIAQYAAARIGLEAVAFNPAGLFEAARDQIDAGGQVDRARILSVVTRGFRIEEAPDPVTYQRRVTVQQTTDVVSATGSQMGEVVYAPIETPAGIFGIHKMERLYRAIAAMAQSGRPKEEPLSVIAIVDSSGSMSTNDANNLRLAAIKMMIDTLGSETRLAVVDFDSVARKVFTLQRLGPFAGSVRQVLREKLNGIDAAGATNIGDGLRLAAEMVDATTGKLAMVLLTDGEDGGWHGEADMLPTGVPVHTIALSDGADRNGLSQLSAATGGVHQIARNANDLSRIMGAIFGEAADTDVVLVKEGTLKQGDVRTYTVVLGGFQGGYVDVDVSWPGSDIDLVLIDPRGRRIDIEDAVRAHQGIEEKTYDIIRLDNPVEGTWQVELNGVDLDPAGEPFTLRVTSRGGPVKARWKTNVVTPEVGGEMSFDLATENDNVTWQRAEVQTWNPSGDLNQQTLELDSVAAALGGTSGQTVLSLRPVEQGVHRVQIIAIGRTDAGESVMRTLDRTFQVVAPGLEVRYKHQIDPFIRRVPGML